MKGATTIVAGLAAGLAALLVGCDAEVHEQMESAVKDLQGRNEVLKRENNGLKTTLDTQKAENTAMERKLYGLQTENAELKKRLDAESTASAQKIAQLTKELATARRGIAVPVADTAPPTPGTSAPATAASAAPVPATPVAAPAAIAPKVASPPAAADETSIAALEKAVADLEGRITALRPKVGQIRSKIMTLARSLVDQPMVPPPGGGICGGCGYYYHADGVPMIYNSEHKHIGPAVKKGDFRTQREKDDAVRQAREEALPMEQELKSLQDELAATKVKLGKLRASQPGT